jgi:hypothetical protein
MADITVVCFVCKRDFAVYGCCCDFPVPLLCNKPECIAAHHSKFPKAAHNEISLQDSQSVTGREDLLRLKHRFVNIEEGKEMLERNLREIDQCRQGVKEHFDQVRADLVDVEQMYMQMLDGYYTQIMDAIHNAVIEARALVSVPEWPADQPNPLAKVVWEYGTVPSSSAMELFAWSASRPAVALKGLVNVQMYSKRFSTYLPDTPKLALIANRCLHEFNANSRKWSGVKLSGDGLANFRHSSDSVHAYYADNLRLLCTGGSSPMTNNAYTIDVITGAITERSRMRFSRASHGMSQYNGKFYVFGGTGAKRTSEKYDPEEDSWSSMPNMKIGHHWFTTCIHHNKIYLCGGDSPVIEYFTPETEEFTEVNLRLEGELAAASFSIASVGEDIAFISAKNLRLWTPESEVLNLKDKAYPKTLKSVWSCMTPVSDGFRYVFMVSQEAKCVKCFDLNTMGFTEFQAPELVDLKPME